MNKFYIFVTDEEGEAIEAMELDVEGKEDAERLTHPLMAQEFAETIQSAVKEHLDG